MNGASRNVTVDEKEVANIQSGGGSGAAKPLPLPDRDIRRKRPPALSFVLRLETLRRIAPVLSLLVLAFIYLKVWTSGKGFLIVLAGIPVYLVWSRLGGPHTRAPEPASR